MTKVQRTRPTGDSSPYGTLKPAVETPIVGTPPAEKQTPEVRKSQTPAAAKSQTPRAVKAPPRPAAQPSAPAAGDEPLYLQLARKEARLRVEQVDALAHLTRQLNRRRTHRGGERLTDNTLIRVAVDVLLARVDELQGNTEEELRASLGLDPGH